SRGAAADLRAARAGFVAADGIVAVLVVLVVLVLAVLVVLVLAVLAVLTALALGSASAGKAARPDDRDRRRLPRRHGRRRTGALPNRRQGAHRWRCRDRERLGERPGGSVRSQPRHRRARQRPPRAGGPGGRARPAQPLAPAIPGQRGPPVCRGPDLLLKVLL